MEVFSAEPGNIFYIGFALKFFDGTVHVSCLYQQKIFLPLKAVGFGAAPPTFSPLPAYLLLLSFIAPLIRLTPEHPFHHSHFLHFFFPDISLQSVRDSQPNLELVEPIFRTGPVFLLETSIRVRNRIISDQAKLPLGFCAHDEPQIQWTPTSGQRSVQDRPQRAWKILFSKTQLARPFYRG